MELELDANEAEINLYLPLRRAKLLIDALQTRTSGEAVTCLRDLIAGHSAILTDLEPSLKSMVSGWITFRTDCLPGHRPVWRPLVMASAQEDRLVLSWKGQEF